MTLFLTLTTAYEIILESMDDGPGLLPFRLGPMTLITHYHNFLQYIDLTNIENRINSVRTQIPEMQTTLPNDTYLLFEIQLSYLHTKLDKVSYQLQSLKPHREKRGLIIGLPLSKVLRAI